MNSISELPLSRNARLILYADDILYHKPVDSEHDVNELQLDVEQILNWIKSNGLMPNSAKTQVLPVTCSREPLDVNIVIDNHPIPTSSSVKYLGVILSSDLTWSKHIERTCKKANRSLGLLHRKFSQAQPSLRKKIFRSVILPQLDYCSSVWDPHLKKDISALDKVQKFAARVVTKQWRQDYPALMSTLNWHPLSTHRTIQKLSLL